MLDRDGYPPGVPCWVDTALPDPEAAIRFYGGLFRWEFEDRMPSDAPGNYFAARLRDRDVDAVGAQQDGSPPTPVWSTYVAVDSADDAATKVTNAADRETHGLEAHGLEEAGRGSVAGRVMIAHGESGDSSMSPTFCPRRRRRETR